VRNFSTFILAIFLTLGTTSFAQTVTVTPTTTLAAETSNNTSAPNSISGSTNGIAASGNISKVPFRDAMYAGANTKVLTALMGWFGDPDHISVGYDSRNPAQVGKQIDDMQSRGIDGTFLAWYGVDSYENTTAQALKQQSELRNGFNFAIMIDHGTIDWDTPPGMTPTQALIYHMNYVADNYFASPAYLRVNGQPVIMEFGMELVSPAIDWPTVRSSVRGNPLVVFRDSEGYSRPLSNGAYVWRPDGTLGDLDDFYSTAVQNPSKIAIGGAAKGFNDTLASWTQNRHASEQCGMTWVNGISEANKYYSADHQLQFIMVDTWNDYEEGTTIESGIDNCVSISASSTNQTIVWTLGGQGQESTLDHYSIYVSTDGQNLMPLTEVPTGTHSLDLSVFSFPAGTYTAYVKAVAKTSLTNHMSGAVTFTSAGAPPTAPTSPSSGAAGDFSLAASPATQTVTRGQSSNYALTLTPTGQLSAPVSFACAGLPSGAACQFASNPLPAGSATATTALTITTSVTSAALMEPSGMPHSRDPKNPGGMLGFTLSTAVFGLFGMGMGSGAGWKRRKLTKRHRKMAMLIVLAVVLLLVATGCGTSGAKLTDSASAATTTSAGPSGSPSTAPTTFTVMVTATSGSTVHTVPLTLKLQ
jgi:hypothetical protein